MAMTETIHKLYVGGEWYETGETQDVTSPYDGRVVFNHTPEQAAAAFGRHLTVLGHHH